MHHPYSTDDFLGLTTDSWTAIITLAAVIVALFQESIKDMLNDASLRMEIIPSPPDTHQINLSNGSKFISKCLYIRIRITHVKGKTAEDVEIMVTNFWKINTNGAREKISSFLPMNLKWSHFQPSITNIRVPKGIFRHCDFGSIRQDLSNENTCYLLIDTMVQPNLVSGDIYPNIIKPGVYEFELMLTGSNTKVLKQCWRLEFQDKWSENENDMLAYLKIEEIKDIEKLGAVTGCLHGMAQLFKSKEAS